MKKIFLLTISAVVFLSCGGDNTTKHATTDSVSHSDHQTGEMTHTSTTDTAGMGGKDMMAMMNGMMDNMKGLQSTGNPDNDFAALMKAHHLGAIEMAQVEVARGSDPQVKAMAQQMVEDQQSEVAQFNSFLSGHNAHGGGDAFFKEAMGAMNNMKMQMDHSGSVDKQFVQMMIPHHQSAIDMAKAYLKTGAHEEALKRMANNIISSQQKEIDALQNWLSKNK